MDGPPPADPAELEQAGGASLAVRTLLFIFIGDMILDWLMISHRSIHRLNPLPLPRLQHLLQHLALLEPILFCPGHMLLNLPLLQRQ